MTQIAAICIALLKGEVLTIGDGFYKLHCSNLPREISRSIVKKFNVEITKDKKEFKSNYEGKPGYYFRYRLNRSLEQNQDGIQRMIAYVKSQTPSNPRTDKEAKEKHIVDQINLF